MIFVNMLVTESASETGCTVLAILTQLTVIAQFVWIAALVSALYCCLTCIYVYCEFSQ